MTSLCFQMSLPARRICRRVARGAKPVAALVAVSVLVVACGSANQPRSASTPSTTPSQSTTTNTTPPAQSPTRTVPPAQTSPAGTPSCATSNLAVSIAPAPGGGAAGSYYYVLTFKNVSGHACELRGYPGVSAVRDGHQSGSAASRDTTVPVGTVTLAPQASAHSMLRIANVGAYPREMCGQVTATSIKVYPPNQKAAVYLPYRFGACSLNGPHFLGVWPVQAGTGNVENSAVLSSKVAMGWQILNVYSTPSGVKHSYPAPSLPVLRSTSVGRHEERVPAYDRISFTFTGTFPSYDLSYLPKLSADPSGKPVRIEGDGVLRIRFTQAIAHDATGHSSVQSVSPVHVGYRAIAGYAQAGDFEGVVTYGVGSFKTAPNMPVDLKVRAVEVSKTDGAGGLRYVVAIDIQTAWLGSPAECPTVATLKAAVPQKIRSTFTSFVIAGCADGWAVAFASRGVVETWLFHKVNGRWTVSDRDACRTGEIPPVIEYPVCHTN